MAIELYKWLLIPVFSFSLFTNEQKADYKRKQDPTSIAPRHRGN